MKQVVKVLKALSEPTRLRIVMLLQEQDLCVCELMFVLDMEQSRISHQLRILRDAELVEDVRDGKWIVYRVPVEVKKKLEPIFGQSFKDDLHRSDKIKKDQSNLKICLQKQIRKSHHLAGKTAR